MAVDPTDGAELLRRLQVFEQEIQTQFGELQRVVLELQARLQLVEDGHLHLITRIDELGKKAGGAEGVIDTRVLGKPGNFEGDHAAWRDWSFIFLGYVYYFVPKRLHNL